MPAHTRITSPPTQSLEEQQVNPTKAVAQAGLMALAFAMGGVAEANVITDWDFGSQPSTKPDNTPAPTTGSGSAVSLGMTNSYTYTTGGTSTGVGAVTLDDITNDSPSGTANGSTLGNGDVWRIRGQAGTGTTGTTNNGWNNSAPEYSQGAQFNVSTAGYTGVSLSFDWASTTQGVGNLQVQYTLNGASWTNIGSLFSATVDNNTTGTAGSGFQTDSISFAAVTGASNDPNFGIRLVSAYNPTLGNEYASATSVVAGAPVQYNNNSGNWRIADVQIDGTPVPLPGAVWLLLSGCAGLAGLMRRRKAAGAFWGAAAALTAG
jgi:hypothetical protein